MSHSKSLIWMRAWHENHRTEQGRSCLSAGVRARCRAKPSLFEVRSGQVNTPGLSQPVCVSKRSWQQTEGCSRGLQANPNVKNYRASWQTSPAVGFGRAGEICRVSSEQLRHVGDESDLFSQHRRETPPVSVMSPNRRCISPVQKKKTVNV